MTEKISRDWQRLATKMVCSYTEEQTTTMKEMVVNRYHTHAKRNRALTVVGILFIIGCLAYPIGTHMFPQFSSGTDSTAEKLKQPVVADSFSGDPNANKMGNEHPVLLGNQKAPQEAPRAIPLSPGTRFSVEEELHVSTYRVSQGSVRFETGPEVTQKLMVRVGALTIEDIGTVFTVEKLPEDQVQVAVTEGKVIVTWPTGHAELKEGTDGTFPCSAKGTALDLDSRSVGADSFRTTEHNWRIAALKGQNQVALKLIDQQPTRVNNRVDDLMLAADVMRLTGNPGRAVPYLNRVIRQFPKDSRRAPAAFTLGKVFLNELGKPVAAAKAFAVAAQNRSPLAEEALAREAEAWHRAGDRKKASQRAKQYLNKFPKGARADSVRTFRL